MSETGFNLYEAFFSRPPELVVEWEDDQTDAVGWLAINSLKGGAAGGGTRMRAGGTREEAILLAKTMAIKFTVAGPDIGGAKSVLRFDPNSDEKEPVLRRWFSHIADHLRTHYGTGSDANMKEAEVTALLSDEIGIRHPQEGIVRGHFGDEAVEQAIRQLQLGVAMEVDISGFGRVEVGDLVTGYGTVRALAHYYAAHGDSLFGKRILLQGFGNVGAAAAHYLAQEGARVVGIAAVRHGEDGRNKFQLASDSRGLDIAAELTTSGRQHGSLHQDRCEEEVEVIDEFWDLEADVFIPVATSDLVTREHLIRLANAGVRVFSCGANGPFEGSSRGHTEVMRFADEQFGIVPDFIANCGAARLFAYLMQTTPEVASAVERKDIQTFLDDVDRTVGEALGEVFNGEVPESGLMDKAYQIYVPRTSDD